MYCCETNTPVRESGPRSGAACARCRERSRHDLLHVCGEMGIRTTIELKFRARSECGCHSLLRRTLPDLFFTRSKYPANDCSWRGQLFDLPHSLPHFHSRREFSRQCTAGNGAECHFCNGQTFVSCSLFIVLISLGLHAYIEVPARRWLRGLWREGPAQQKRILAYLLFASPGLAAILVLFAAPIDLTASVTSGLRVVVATYGANCHALRGNATRASQRGLQRPG